MEERIQKALENHKKGYNCSQSVACAFCDLVQIEEDLMFRMMEAYGLGMGNMQGTCGAISGAIAVVGMQNSTGMNRIGSKKDTYKKAKEIMDQFAQWNTSTTCANLKGVSTGKKIRTCDRCIEDAARLLAGYLKKNMGIKLHAMTDSQRYQVTENGMILGFHRPREAFSPRP